MIEIKQADQDIVIRAERESDYQIVENMTRKAFWNLYIPGCTEHYLVHKMRSHKDFVSALDLVIELNGQVIGNIMYTQSRLVDESGTEKEILTFGPVSILPEYQRQGYGKLLLDYSFQEALRLGYSIIVIFGNPSNYVNRGFKSCKKYNIALEDGTFPTAMMAKVLTSVDYLDGRRWTYYSSPIMDVDEKEAENFDKNFEQMTKGYQASQDEFYIYSHSFVH